jgi:hypothetical protein
VRRLGQSGDYRHRVCSSNTLHPLSLLHPVRLPANGSFEVFLVAYPPDSLDPMGKELTRSSASGHRERAQRER